MVCYYDSSILLSAILEQQPAEELAGYWDDVDIRLSSILLKIECLTGIRRAGVLQNHEEPISIVTLDNRMRRVATKPGFALLPV